MLVIADQEKAIGLAGVMGGLDTEISASTKYVFLEAACFEAVTTRKTSRALGLRSEASSRFEHGIDRENTIVALDRAAELLEKLGACKVCVGRLDSYPLKLQPLVLTTTAESINAYLGTDITQAKMVDILEKLGFGVEQRAKELLVQVPSWRNDVSVAADISEEIARINGYDNIVGTLPIAGIMQGKQSELAEMSEAVRDCLCGSGLAETISYSFTNASQIDKLNLAPEDRLRAGIEVLNPIIDEFKIMRTTLVASVLATVEHNLSHRNEDVAIFELGSVYLANQLPLSDFPREETCLCAALTGNRKVADWNQVKEPLDFYDVKGLVEELFASLNITEYEFQPGNASYLHPGKSAMISYQGNCIGVLGEVHPKVAAAFNLTKATYLLDMKLQPLVEAAGRLAQYKPLPKYPQIYRDLSMLVPVEVSHQMIANAISKSAGSLLNSIRLFDLYTGKQVEAGFKSMAYALSFQAKERTLTDEEVDKGIKEIVNCLESELKIKLRG